MITDFQKFFGNKEDYLPGVHTSYDFCRNPYEQVNISILVPSCNLDEYTTCFECLAATIDANNIRKVEVITKIDNPNEAIAYAKVLNDLKFTNHKILIFPSFHARWTNHHCYNDMVHMASGKMFFITSTDMIVEYGDWYNLFLDTRDKYFKDNIYFIHVPSYMSNGRRSYGSCAVTPEWVKVLGFLYPVPNCDSWMGHISYQIKREIILEEKDIRLHYPPGSRVMGKYQKIHLFGHMLDKAVEIFRSEIDADKR
tara:strand:+ start:58 stop:819 length:762 start_codon:yes stop_codon:yes gene_type:complete